MRTIIYIDGFNLYYRALKHRPHCKWLDVKKLSQELLSKKNDIIKIKYFTARVSPTESDPTVNLRQNSYLNALKAHIPEIEIIEGHFSEHRVRAYLAKPINEKNTAMIIKREEKGSDVNLAVHFLYDAMTDQYDCGVIISNDSDLAEALKLVKKGTQKTVGVLSPSKQRSKELSQYCDFHKSIQAYHLKKSQLPDNINNIQRNTEWCHT